MTLRNLRRTSRLPRMTLEAIAKAYGMVRGTAPITKQAVLQMERRHIGQCSIDQLKEYAQVIGLPRELLIEYITQAIWESEDR